MDKVLLVGAHGIGDCLLSLQCAYHVQTCTDSCEVHLAVRNEVYEPLDHLFSRQFRLKQINVKYGEDNAILHNSEYLKEVSQGFDEVYYIIPDLLYRNPLAFAYDKYFLNPLTIKTTRLLTGEVLNEGLIYVGLAVPSPERHYQAIPQLLKTLAQTFPNSTIYFPNIKIWDNKPVSFGDFSGLPENVFVDESGDFEQSLGFLRSACYFIGADNGPSHIAWHLGIPRLILDHAKHNPAYIARWREDITESISFHTNPTEIAKLAKINLEIPQTTLLPRDYVLVNLDSDWAKNLIFKY